MLHLLTLATIFSGFPAFDYYDSIGENLHVDQSAGQWQNYPLIESLLGGMSVPHVRSSLTIYPGPNGQYVNFMNKLYDDLGITSVEIVGPNITTTAQAQALINTRRGVKHVEGPNEQDICCNDTAWIAHDQATIAALAPIPAANPGVTIIAPSVSMADPALLGNLVPPVQAGNAHPYTGKFIPETQGWGGSVYGQIYGSIAYSIAAAQRSAPGVPVAATEEGYSSGDVSETTQASYDERVTLWNFIHGIISQWLYDLLDDSQSYGVARIDGSLKPAAYGLQGLFTILRDKTRFMGTCSLNATISTSVAYDSALFCKSSGEIDLVLWQPAQLQDPGTGASTPATPAAVTVTANVSGPSVVYLQSPVYQWSSVVPVNRGAISGALTERPLIIAFNSGAPIALPALPVIATGLIHGKPITPGHAHISPGS